MDGAFKKTRLDKKCTCHFHGIPRLELYVGTSLSCNPLNPFIGYFQGNFNSEKVETRHS